MYNYLNSFPFHENEALLSGCQCPSQGFDPPSFKLYSESDRLPTFALRLPPLGEEPDLTYAKECIRIKTCKGVTVASVTMEQAGVKLLKDSNSYYLIYDGSRIPDIKLECGECYRLKIAGYFSEPFYITNTPQEKLRIEFSNKFQLGDVPYQAEFTQALLVDGEICSLDAELFENRKSENNGKETISYQRLTYRKGMSIHSAPDYIAQLIGAAGIHDTFTVFHKGEEITTLKKRVKSDLVQNGCCDYDIEVNLPLRDIEIIGGNCQTDVDTTLTEVEIPDDLPDSCTIDEDWIATDEVLCLKIGEVPPPIAPPITPVGTPPVVPACPPNGFELGSQSFTTDCTNPWIKEGVKYKRKVTKTTANGTCGSTTSDFFYDVCVDLPADNGSVVLTNIKCTTVAEPEGETSVKPNWLNKLAFTHDVNTNEFTLYWDATENASSRIVAKSGTQPAGNGWDSTTWQDGTAAVGGYTELARYNPVTIGQGGILRVTEYRIYIRRNSNPGVVYYKDFTTQNVSNPFPPTDIVLSNPDLPNCQLGPFLDIVFSANETESTFRFNAQEVERFDVRIREGASIVRNAEMVYFPKASDFDKVEAAKPNPLIQFFYNNSPTFVYQQLAPGVNRTIEIEGSSCKSEQISSLPFNILGTALQFNTGYPRYVNAGSDVNIEIRINKSESQLTVVRDLDTNTVLYNNAYGFTSGVSLVIADVTPGHNFKIDVGSLTANLFIPPPVEAGEAFPIILSHAMPIHIQIEITGSSMNWVFNDRSTYGVNDPYEFTYRIGGEVLRQSTPLTNYQWRSNCPVRIIKAVIKKSAAGLWQWADANGITLDDTVSPGFTYNESVVYVNLIFQGGESDFVNPILPGMNPSQGQVQYMDIAPDCVLPHGHGWIIQKGIYTLDDILEKGATNIPNGQLPWDTSIADVIQMENDGLSYSDVPLNNVLLGLPRNESIPETFISNPPGQGWPYTYNPQVYPNGPLTESESIAAANQTGAVHHAMHVGESEEGWPAISSHWPMWRWFYAQVKQLKINRFTARGIAHWTCHNYFTIGTPPVWTLGGMGKAAQKTAFNRPFADWEFTQFSPGGTLVDTDMICQAVYLGAPDKESAVYASVYFMEVARKAGKKGCMFYAEVHEWRPNNHGSVPYPDGIFYRQGKVPVDPSDTINYSFLGHVHGHVTIHWAAKPKVDNRFMDPNWNYGDIFFANGSSEPSAMPYYQYMEAGRRYFGYNGMEDIFNMGVLLFAQTFAQVEGGVSRFLKFRIDGGSWITPSNNQMDDLIDAFYDKRGYVYSREKDGLLAFYYVNQYGAGTQHILEVQNPHNSSIVWSGRVSANMVHVKMINL